jgi:hypothetical protein
MAIDSEIVEQRKKERKGVKSRWPHVSVSFELFELRCKRGEECREIAPLVINKWP